MQVNLTPRNPIFTAIIAIAIAFTFTACGEHSFLDDVFGESSSSIAQSSSGSGGGNSSSEEGMGTNGNLYIHGGGNWSPQSFIDYAGGSNAKILVVTYFRQSYEDEEDGPSAVLSFRNRGANADYVLFSNRDEPDLPENLRKLDGVTAFGFLEELSHTIQIGYSAQNFWSA